MYCSPACRQAAYRKRPTTTNPALRLLNSDLDSIAGRDKACRAAVRILERYGYSVRLEQRGAVTPPAPSVRAPLTLVIDKKADPPTTK